MLRPRVKVVKSRTNAELPRYMSEGAAGADVCAAIDTELTLEPGMPVLVPTGLSVQIPIGFEMQVRPRSGLARKYGVTVANAPGTIDSDYRGEVGVLLINLGRETYNIAPGERIAQLVVAPVSQAEFALAESLEESDRGTGGFGSTGSK